MIIFSYCTTSLDFELVDKNKIFRIVITDDEKDNVTTWFRGKKYKHTLAPKDIEHIIKIIKVAPGLFDIPKELEPNESLGGGTIYGFTFCDGKRTNSFYGKDILDYGRRPRKNATLALRTAREIKEKVLEPNNIRTMISSRLQHWPKYRKESDFIPVCGCPKLPK
ncbi:MAG: hypothetical protein K6F57_03480 [Candidatus Saccharibacteria bacterium]|nr:hypothetical protein [Candidatus Saccharibacteria bacterium]